MAGTPVNALNINTPGIPVFSGTAFSATTTTPYNILAGSTGNAISNIAPSATSGIPLISQGSSSNPIFGTTTVPGGGTGVGTLTGIVTGNGTSAFTASLITEYNVLIGGASNAINSVSPSVTSGVPLISQGSLSLPAFGTTVVAGGGTGNTSATPYAVICGGTTSTGAFQSIAGVGSSSQVLTSNGASSLPNFQSLPLSSITLTADDTSSVTGNNLTISGGATGLTTSASGSTLRLLGELDVSNGGTGAYSLTGVLIGNGTAPISANPITQYDILIGGGSNSITSLAPSATTGIPLISQGSTSNPAFGTVVVAGGGTGDTSFTAYAPIVGGTTTTGVLQSASTGITNSGYVFTSTGGSSIPTWQALPSGSITLTADNAGTATGTNLTISGGTTGLTTTASGTTVDLTGTLNVGHGGTGAATLTGILTGNGTSAVTASAVTQYQVLTAGGSNAVSGTTLTNGQLLIGSTGTIPAAGGLGAGTGISIVTGAGQITVNALGGGLSWISYSGTALSFANNTGYFNTSSSLCTFTLPTGSVPAGTVVAIAGVGTGGWQIAQNSGNQIFFGSSSTTAGTSGYLASTNVHDTVHLLCTTANAHWQVISSIGNITVN